MRIANVIKRLVSRNDLLRRAARQLAFKLGYSQSLAADDLLPARSVLQQTLAVEKRFPAVVHPAVVHKEWRKACRQLRDCIHHEDFSYFLHHPTCRYMFDVTWFGSFGTPFGTVTFRPWFLPNQHGHSPPRGDPKRAISSQSRIGRPDQHFLLNQKQPHA